MKNKICLDMYLLTIILLAMVVIGFGIREMMLISEENQNATALDLRLKHLGELQVR